MKVRCISNQHGSVRYRITVGREYVALGMSLAYGTDSVWNIWLRDDPGNYFVPTPFSLLEIVEPTVSIYWLVELSAQGARISAKEFLEPSFLENLTNLDDRHIRTFQSVAAMIENEANTRRA